MSTFGGNGMSERATECELKASECVVLKVWNRELSGSWLMQAVRKKTEGLAGVFLEKVDKEFLQ